MLDIAIEGAHLNSPKALNRVKRVAYALDHREKMIAELRKHLNMKKNPPKVKIFPFSLEDRLNHTRTKQPKPTMHILTSQKDNSPCSGDKTGNPFSQHSFELNIIDLCPDHRSHLNDVHFQSNNGQNNVKTKLLQKYKKYATTPIKTRIAVKSDPLPPSKTKLDPNYFTCVKGRPIKELFNPRLYVSTRRSLFFKTLFVGLESDTIKMWKEHYSLDMWKLEKISVELDKNKYKSELLMSDLHDESVRIVNEQLDAQALVRQYSQLRDEQKGKMTAAKSSIYRKDYRLSNVILGRDFLLAFSPSCYRTDYLNKTSQYKTITNAIVDRVIALYEDYCRYNPEYGNDVFLDEAISLFIQQVSSLGPAEIYFKHTWEINLVLRRMELDCVNLMGDIMWLKTKHDHAYKIGKDVNKYYRKLKKNIELKIEERDEVVSAERERVTEVVEQTNQDINSSIKNVFTGDIVLETFALVEVLFEEFFGPSKQKCTPLEMMLRIEDELENIDVQLEAMGPARYNYYEKIVMAKMTKMKNDSSIAKRRYREAIGSIKKVRNIFTPPLRSYKWRKGNYRSMKSAARRNMTIKNKHPEDSYTYLQLDGICNRDDIEDTIQFLLKSNDFVGSREKDKILKTHGSLISGASSETLLKALKTGKDSLETKRSLSPSFSLLELGFDSEEELIRNNYEKRRAKGVAPVEPAVMYDVKHIDDRFMLPIPVKILPKDGRHVHRQQHPSSFHPLNWR